MPDDIRRGNATKSRVRSAVEHVFGQQKDRMGLFIRTVGLELAKAKLGLVNIAYNMKRLIFVTLRLGPPARWCDNLLRDGHSDVANDVS